MIETDQAPQPQYYPNPLESQQSTMLMLTDVNEPIRKLMLFYMGQQEDNQGNTIQVGEQLLSSEGIHSVIGQIETVVNRITTMTAFNRKRDIPKILKVFYKPLVQDLLFNKVRYNIKNNADRNKIYWCAFNLALITAKRADGETLTDKKFMKGSQQ